MDDSQERPVAFVSRTMNVAEKKYSKLEKEALHASLKNCRGR